MRSQNFPLKDNTICKWNCCKQTANSDSKFWMPMIILTFYCIHTLQHVSSGLSPSIFSLNPVSTLPLPLAVFGMLAPRFGTHSLLIWDLSTLTQPSNPTSRLIFILFCKHFWPLTILYALLINISCYFSAEIILQLQLQFDEKHRKVLFNPLCNPYFYNNEKKQKSM